MNYEPFISNFYSDEHYSARYSVCLENMLYKLSIADLILIALLNQKELAVNGKILFVCAF